MLEARVSQILLRLPAAHKTSSVACKHGGGRNGLKLRTSKEQIYILKDGSRMLERK